MNLLVISQIKDVVASGKLLKMSKNIPNINIEKQGISSSLIIKKQNTKIDGIFGKIETIEKNLIGILAKAEKNMIIKYNAIF